MTSYKTYLSVQKMYIRNIIDSFISDILKTFFLNLLKIRKFKVESKLLDSISAFYYRLNLEHKVLSYYKYIC